jgi:hypothetical protein
MLDQIISQPAPGTGHNAGPSLADDTLETAGQLALFLFGINDYGHRRKVYRWVDQGLPVDRRGAILRGRKSTILAWIAAREAAAKVLLFVFVLLGAIPAMAADSASIESGLPWMTVGLGMIVIRNFVLVAANRVIGLVDVVVPHKPWTFVFRRCRWLKDEQGERMERADGPFEFLEHDAGEQFQHVALKGAYEEAAQLPSVQPPLPKLGRTRHRRNAL